MKIAKSLEGSGLLIKVISEIISKKAKKVDVLVCY